MKSPIIRFVVRWLVSALGLWIAAGLLSGKVSYGSNLGVLVIAGLLLAVLNTVLKPLLVILSLPAILFTLGLFMIVINGIIVVVVSKLYSPLQVEGFGTAMLAGMVIGLVNYLVTTILEDK
jgi:putative membrane protein